MTASGFLEPIAGWLGTFAVHSTCALLAALVTSLALRRRALAWQERLLRFALWAALVSSTVQFLVVGSPLPLLLPNVPVPGSWGAGAAVAEPMSGAAAATDGSATTSAAASAASASLLSPTVLVGAAALLLFLGGCWFLRLHLRLRAVLRSRTPEADPRVLCTASRVARDLGLQQSPRLSRSDRLATPIAFGWLRPEICLPVRAQELSDHSLQAMLAHEVAHLRRHDPAWMWVAAGLQALFPWQPLLLVVRRRWARLVELRCDAIAAAHSSPTAVARCLLDVAEWLRPRTAMPIVAFSMAARPSALRERIEAALRPQAIGGPRRIWSSAFAGASLSALTLMAPALQTTHAIEATPTLLRTGPADVPSTTSTTSLRQAAALLDQEYATVQREVARVRADVAGRRDAKELEQLVSMLSHRLLVVERLRKRLEVLLDRRDAVSPMKPRSKP